MSCNLCGGTEFDYDASSGQTACQSCGNVIDESRIVAEITFGEASSGAAVPQGTYIGSDQRRARINGPYRKHSEPREQTIKRGRSKINSIATALGLSPHHSETAQRYFNLAIANNFIQGRSTELVVAACVYIVCRKEKTCHMLIDLADVLQTNVFTLGSTFLKLVRELHMKLPLVDPSLYITRFAQLLEFGDEAPKVALDASRLVQRMDRDWMQTGRRPAGICGACLLVAARMNNFRRSMREIIAVVKIADVTVKRRLEEFKATPSGQLSVTDFKHVWLDQACDPPAFTKARKLAKLAENRKASSSATTPAPADIENTISDQENDANFVSIASPSSNQPYQLAGTPNSVTNDEIISLSDDNEDEVSGTKRRRNTDDYNGDEEEDRSYFDASDVDEEDIDIAEEMNSYLNSSDFQEAAEEMEGQIRAERRARIKNDSELGSDLDDEEVNNAILNEEEIKIKTKVWMTENIDHLRMVAAKKAKALRDQANGIGPSQKRKRPKKSKNNEQEEAATPAEAAKRMLTEKRLSKKINYEALDRLFESNPLISKESDSIVNTPRSWEEYDEYSVSGAGLKQRVSDTTTITKKKTTNLLSSKHTADYDEFDEDEEEQEQEVDEFLEERRRLGFMGEVEEEPYDDYDEDEY
ncbi:2207_t:CDS:10 [Ambispora leptoticha]|uniref:B-related factor 1 n=1 Tax=Ambispora leptoticha TaxID=144679 RepID=A0A9N9BX94_9GLOM|nr:2207_t:CDS:10 [Ambispora leptoticha]